RPMFSRVLTLVFFIFMVSNIGGCLTPLGDPPLFLGFLKGVEFQWTLRLWKEWAFALAVLLTVFYVWDRYLFSREPPPPPSPEDEVPEDNGIHGKRNIWLLAAVMGAVLAKGIFDWPFGPQEILLGAVAVVSMWVTPKEVRKKNHFTFGPILEVAILFSGIFTVMVPVLAILRAKGGELGLTEPWHYFWITGTLSSFLDNAPTYLVFAQTAASQVGVDRVGDLMDAGPTFLAAVSVGAVFMGANTYIGNGPNFMVKAIAEENGIRMPSFFGFMKYSLLILLPLFVIVTLIFLI
ncbi:MAG: sodium:proton antiporter, partial [Planctomycetota bacterium]